ncbi:class I SAM-dependent methyltransferase [uncultured Psychroserpens sp.]|uniref:class I SAM-dependent methyltransferase n=1 Tax=uncultured Psychroserpens sp. TaxID=255436 RepID=UPI00260B15EA|nr:class I SAM-dependent methyltransferase [uncultured Psychroserpens sp.]
MTTYEWMRWFTFPVMPTILVTVRKDLKQLIKHHKKNNQTYTLLDVGGRKSPYTINLKSDIALLDIPQESETQEELNLGFTSDILTSIQKERSNIKEVVIQDMTRSTLKDETYDAVVSVEVIEHVEEDELFVKNIAAVVKKGGWAYFTTPNGDYIKNEPPNNNPDHKRHYTRAELQTLLEKYFDRAEVIYAVKTGKYRLWGLKRFDIKNPLKLLKSMIGNVLNRYESKGLESTSVKTAHLIAKAYKY